MGNPQSTTKKLRYLGWEGYADGRFAAAFHKYTGLNIEGTAHLSDDLACRLVVAEPQAWDIININTPFVRDVLYPRGLIRPISSDLAMSVREIGGIFSRFKAAAESHDGYIMGIPQRCGPFNLVINQKRIACSSAREDGFSLVFDPGFEKRFGILAYEDFNVMHIAIAGGINPFAPLDDLALLLFADTAQTILESASIITADHHALNRALIDGDIDFYISGGTYTASPARLAGCLEVTAITPDSGPIEGKGGISFVEINALVAHSHLPPGTAERFLRYIDSEDGALAAATAGGACNPVVQMYRPSVSQQFTPDQLIAMQWDDLEHDLSRCADYAIIPDYARLLAILRSAASRTGRSARWSRA